MPNVEQFRQQSYVNNFNQYLTKFQAIYYVAYPN